jgi:hypothetical protein
MLIRQATKVINHRLRSYDSESDRVIPRELPSIPTGQLEEYREPAMSVTDHTTKTLDSVQVRRD